MLILNRGRYFLQRHHTIHNVRLMPQYVLNYTFILNEYIIAVQSFESMLAIWTEMWATSCQVAYFINSQYVLSPQIIGTQLQELGTWVHPPKPNFTEGHFSACICTSSRIMVKTDITARDGKIGILHNKITLNLKYTRSIILHPWPQAANWSSLSCRQLYIEAQ